MSSTPSCPTAAMLMKLIDRSATPEEQADLAHHLDGCAACQAALDRLSGGRDSGNAFARQLGQRFAAEPELAKALNRLAADMGGTATAIDQHLAREVKLDFLDPPEKPGQLGKLAHYEILEVIGRGGMGIVLKANDTKLQRIVAIKVMAPELAAIGSSRQRFSREARAAAAVAHDHVVTIHGVEEDHSPPYLVMQYIQGRSLQQRIDECGALEVKEILRIGLQAASGLAAAHAQGLVHRDIKPANILLENGVERVKITDFGLARVMDDARITRSGEVAGTPQYMSPEQANGKPVDHRADLFSLGGVLYAMCTGYAPFRASSSMAVLKKVCDETPRPIRDLNPEIPDWLAAIVDKLMAKDPKDRFAGAAEVANLLEEHLAHLQQPAVFPQPAKLPPPVTVKPAPPAVKESLALPIFLMLAPVLLAPILFLAIQLVVFRPVWLVMFALVALGGASMLAGAIMLMIRLAKRGNQAWIIVLVLLVLFVACPLPVIGLFGAFGWVALSPSPGPGPNVASEMHVQPGIDHGVFDPNAMGELGRAMNELNPKGPILGDRSGSARGPLADGLNWFPEETTFCASFSFQNSPAEMSDALWGMAKSIGGTPKPIEMISNAIDGGTIVRLSIGYIEDPAGKRSRHFARLSGLWNRNRVIDAIAVNPRVTTAALQTAAGEQVTILNVDKEFALAVVGSQEILLGAYDRIPEGSKGHEEVIRELLECKNSSKRSLRHGPLGADTAVADEVFCLIAGELPAPLHEAWKSAFGVIPRKIKITMAEADKTAPPRAPLPGLEDGPDVKIGLNLTMRNRGDVDLLAQHAGRWPHQLYEFLDKSLSAAAARFKAGRDPKQAATIAKARPQLQIDPKFDIAVGTKGFDFAASMQVPATVWRAFIAWAKANPPFDSKPAAALKLLKRFDPKVDTPLTKESFAKKVTEDDGGWRIEKGRTNNTDQDLYNSVPVRLFEIARPEIQGRRVTLRALVKSEAVNPAFQGCFALQADAGREWPGSREPHFGQARTGKTNWTPYEISFDCPAGIKPQFLRIDAFLAWEGKIWIKDIEVVTTPLGVSPASVAPAPAANPAREVVIKKFSSIADKPITKEVSGRKLTEDELGWKVESSDNTSYLDDSSVPRVHLFEVPNTLASQDELIVRFKARTENAESAFLEVSGGYTNRSPAIQGSTNWKAYEVQIVTANAVRVKSFAIDLVIRNSRGAKAQIWLKDLEVINVPWAARPKPPAKEILLKKFDPKVDRPFQTEVGDQRVTLDGDAWRIEAKTVPGKSSLQELRLFELSKHEVRHSAIVLRFKMKTEKVAENVAASVTLRVGAEVRDWLGRYGNPVTGTTAWKDYEVRCECGDLPPADIGIFAGISAFNGTMWLKDLELVKVPRE